MVCHVIDDATLRVKFLICFVDISNRCLVASGDAVMHSSANIQINESSMFSGG